MSNRLRKLMLSLHVVTSVGLVGAVASFFLLSLLGLMSANEAIVRSTYVAMNPIARTIIVPLAICALLVGVIQSLTTQWGLFRHYWVIFKLAITIIVILVLLMQLSPIAALARYAAESSFDPSALYRPRLSAALHAGIGLIVLLVPVILSIFKPGRPPGSQRPRASRSPSCIHPQALARIALLCAPTTKKRVRD